MNIDVLVETELWEALDIAALAGPACAATLSHLGFDAAKYNLAILACDDARIAELNGDFREKPQPTNVLSWPSEERGAQVEGGTPLAPEDTELGDIAIAFETCKREAAEQDKDFAAHVTHLIVHATLHLLGYDHIRDVDATLMERLEVEILGKLGLADPYS